MRILVLGGTGFLGAACASEARCRGHEVTAPGEVPAGAARAAAGNGTGAGAGPVAAPAGAGAAMGLDRLLRKGRWDAVLETRGEPPAVRAAARTLSSRAGTYVLAPAVRAADPAAVPAPCDDVPAEACESAVREEFGGAVALLAGGWIVGPGEPGGRLAWWLDRASGDAPVALPGSPGTPVRPVDVRDVAAVAVDLAEAGDAGRFTAAPEPPLTLGEFFASCELAAGGSAEAVWGGGPGPGAAGGAGTADGADAGPRRPAAGTRPYRDRARTVADTLAWRAAGGRG